LALCAVWGLGGLGIVAVAQSGPSEAMDAPRLVSRAQAPLEPGRARRSQAETIYAMPDDGRFSLRRVKGGAWLTFEGSDVSRYLFESVGGRGDLIFRDASGKVVLRFTDFGAGTLFTEEHPTGLPVEPLEVDAEQNGQ
jgi:hypothetical protein